MTVYTAGQDYPSRMPDSDPPNNLVAASQYAGVYVKTGSPVGGVRVYGLFFDVYLSEFDQTEEDTTGNGFRYQFVYWYMEGELKTKGRFVGKAGYKKTLVESTTRYNNQYEVLTGFLGKTFDLSNTDERFALESYGNEHRSTRRTPREWGWQPVILGPGATSWGDPANGQGWQSYYKYTTGDQESGGDTAPGAPTAPDNTADDPIVEEPLPDLNLFNAPTRWNPPLIATATGAYVPVDLGGGSLDLSEPNTRDIILGSGAVNDRIRRKGYLRQYIVSAEDFRVNTEKETNVESPDWDNNQAIIDLDKPWVYGFRFHYNPEQVSMGTLPINNIDPAFIISGKESAFPAAAEGAQVSFPLYLNRIEDVSLMQQKGYQAFGQQLYKRGYSKKDRKLLDANKRLYWRQDLEGIRDRGTGYDLEFLYRCAMGRPFPTALRGDTADLGIILGLPMQLKLSRYLNYVGRLTQLSYNHVMFSENMVPMFTVVNITFTRIPDAQQFDGASE